MPTASSSNPYTIAIIPARGGSKRVPRKNLIELAGRPLVVHSIQHALAARTIRETIVSTDDPDINRVSHAAGAQVLSRPLELSGDTVTSEAVLLHVLDHRRTVGLADPDLVVFLQATSPIRRAGEIDAAVEQAVTSGVDSLFSACENSRFIWAMKDGQPYSVNYDYHRRQREQDLAVQYRENGSIYVFKPSVLRDGNNRLGGRMGVFEMDYWSSFQIDTPEHVELCRWILTKPEYRPAVEWPEPIALVVFDFDGVMTDNGVWIDETGRESVRCNRGDGWGIDQLRRLKVPMMVLSTEVRPLAAERCAKLQIPCIQSVADKAGRLEQHCRNEGIDLSHVVYVGNDVNDLEAMRLVGFPVAVSDAHPRVLEVARLVLTTPGGFGAVREFCDRLSSHVASRSLVP